MSVTERNGVKDFIVNPVSLVCTGLTYQSVALDPLLPCDDWSVVSRRHPRMKQSNPLLPRLHLNLVGVVASLPACVIVVLVSNRLLPVVVRWSHG